MWLELTNEILEPKLRPYNVTGFNLLRYSDKLQPPSLFNRGLDNNRVITLTNVHLESWLRERRDIHVIREIHCSDEVRILVDSQHFLRERWWRLLHWFELHEELVDALLLLLFRCCGDLGGRLQGSFPWVFCGLWFFGFISIHFWRGNLLERGVVVEVIVASKFGFEVAGRGFYRGGGVF